MPVLEFPIEAPEGERNYLAAFGYMVTSWNRADNALRQLLAGLCGGKGVQENLRALIVTAEMGSRDLHHALDSFVSDILESPVADRVAAASKWHDILLEYRNFYIHGISSVWSTGVIGGEFDFGLIHRTSAKGQLKATIDQITPAQIRWLTEQSELLRRFISALLHHMFWSGPEFNSPPTPPPDIPTLPKRLQKTQSLLRVLIQQNQAFQESQK